MTDTQILTIALASVPTMIAVLMGILVNNARLTDLRVHLDERFRSVDHRFSEVDRRFNEMDQRFNVVDQRFSDIDRKMDRRFDEMKELWRSELHRVEEILDARL